MARKKTRPDIGKVFNWYLQRVLIPDWKKKHRPRPDARGKKPRDAAQKLLAEASGVKPSAISIAARYGRGIGLPMVTGLAEAFNMTEDQIIRKAREWHTETGFQGTAAAEAGEQTQLPPNRAAGERGAFEVLRATGCTVSDIRRWADAVAKHLADGEDPFPEWWLDQIRAERARETKPRRGAKTTRPMDWGDWNATADKVCQLAEDLPGDEDFWAALEGFGETPTTIQQPDKLTPAFVKQCVDEFLERYPEDLRHTAQWARWTRLGRERHKRIYPAHPATTEHKSESKLALPKKTRRHPPAIE